MNRESHLAGVIGHEIGHVTARHGAQRAAQQQLAGVASIAVAIGTGSGDLLQLSQILGGALMSGYGRKQELQSDELGAKYIAQNNYDPEDMIGVIGILKDQELFNAARAREEGREVQGYHGLFASHPRNDTRLQGVIKAAEKYRDSTQPEPDDGRFLRLTNGMVFGESESQGITRGNRFYHKGLNLFLAFPEGWQVINQPSELIGVAPGNNEIVRMRMAPANSTGDIDDFLRSNFQGFRDGQRIQLDDGGQAYAGIATLSDQRTQQQQNVRVSAVQRDDQRFLILGQGRNALPNKSFFDTVRSMRGLQRNEQSLASESKIQLITVQPGDTFAKLARQSSLSDYAEEQLRLINNAYPDGEPLPGTQIKFID
jgi:predicted Zn-dependent protease